MKSIRKMIIGLAVMLLGIGLEVFGGFVQSIAMLIIGGIIIIVGMLVVVANNDGSNDNRE